MKYCRHEVGDAKTWSDLVNAFVPMDQRYHDASTWHAVLTVQETPSYRMLRWRQRGERTAYRTPSQIRRTPCDEHYWIVVPHTGVYSVRQDDATTHVPPGFASVMTLSESCHLHIPDSDAHAIHVPRAVIDNRVGSDKPLSTVLDLRSGLGRITRDLIRSVHAEGENLAHHEFNAVCDRLSELLGMLALGDQTPQKDYYADVVAATRRYVREHVGAAELRLPAVAHVLGWSPRQLRLVLRQSGTTFRELRQEEALRRARDVLRDPAATDVAIADIAQRVGFTPTWFSSAFKARYGESPREFRGRSLARAPSSAT